MFRWPSMTWSTSSLPRSSPRWWWQPSLVSTVKSASPSTLVLQYKEPMGLADDCGTLARRLPDRDHLPAGAGPRQGQPRRPLDPAQRERQSDPEPLLRPYLAGERRFRLLPAAVGDERDRGGQAARLRRHLHRQRTPPTSPPGHPGGRLPDPVPVRCRLADGNDRFMASVGPKLKAEGLYVRATAGGPGPGSAANKAWWTALAPDFDGLVVQEYFEMAAGSKLILKYNDPTDYHGDCNAELGIVDNAQNLGKDFFGGMLPRRNHRHRHRDDVRQSRDPAQMERQRRRLRLATNDATTPGTPPGQPTSAPPAAPCTPSAAAGAATTPAAPSSSTPTNQPAPHHLQPRRQLHHPRGTNRHQRHPPTRHRHDPHRRIDTTTPPRRPRPHANNDDDANDTTTPTTQRPNDVNDDNDTHADDDAPTIREPADDLRVQRKRGRR